MKEPFTCTSKATMGPEFAAPWERSGAAQAYYNEHDREKATCLRAFIAAGLVAPGDVDERSIKDVQPGDLVGYRQCHFFAGWGIWSYAARAAGWPDDRPLWTGSCPCPSFSAAGKGAGFDDPRHLWPDWARLIRQCRPAAVFGEQVDDAIGFGWLDLVQADLEAQAYAVGKAVLGACSVGAPCIRQRLFFMAVADGGDEGSGLCDHGSAGLWRLQPRDERGAGFVGSPTSVGWREGWPESEGQQWGSDAAEPGTSSELVGTERAGLEGHAGHGDRGDESGWIGAQPVGSVAAAGSIGGMGSAVRTAGGEFAGSVYRTQIACEGAGHTDGSLADGPAGAGEDGGLAFADGRGPGHERVQRSGQHGLQPQDGGVVRLVLAAGERRERRETSAPGHDHDGQAPDGAQGQHGLGVAGAHGLSGNRPRPLNGYWRDADWLLCRDGRWRPVAPGTFPLAHGYPNRIPFLRAAGDAINAEVARAFIESAIEVIG